MKIIELLTIILVFVTGAEAFAQSEQGGQAAQHGKFLGAIEAKHPAWFKESFLDFSEDIDEASASGKRLVLYFWQAGCPYCNQLWDHNMAVDGIEAQFQSGFDVVAINMWGDQEVITVAGKQFTEKQLARALDVDFTPTLLFYDEHRKNVLRVNGYLPPERFKLALEYASGEYTGAQTFNEFITSRVSGAGELARTETFFTPAVQALPQRNERGATRPLAVLFETASCAECERFHDVTLAHKNTRELLKQMDVVQLNAHSEASLTLPDGTQSSPAAWANSLGLSYYPSMVFFDEQGVQVAKINAYFRNFHTQSIFAYVLEKAYLQQPSFQRYITARAEALQEQGIDVDIWEE